jgi:hypothetical protein
MLISEWRGFYPVIRGCQGETTIYATQAQAITLAQSEREKSRRDIFGNEESFAPPKSRPDISDIWSNANTKIFVLISTDPAGEQSTVKFRALDIFVGGRKQPHSEAFRLASQNFGSIRNSSRITKARLIGSLPCAKKSRPIFYRRCKTH